jgi:hypothetical protein
MIACYYALGGINYKNGVITTCPRQSDQLVFARQTIIPSEIYNHENFTNLRKKLYNDQWPTGCSTCQEMEKYNLKSMRHDYFLDKNNVFNKNDGDLFTEPTDYKLMDCYDPSTHKVAKEGLRHLEFRFSTACNFACLHCSEVYSSGWKKKLNNFTVDAEVKAYNLRQLLGTEHRHGPNDKEEMRLTTEQALKICEDLNENFPYLQYIDFAGGELLYQKQFFPTLRKLAEHPNAKNMLISFHSNFNADFDISELTSLLKPFKESCIIISVDAGKNIYPYFRHGGKWEKLKSNIEEFKKINDFTWIDTSITTSVYQILDIYDVFESILSLNCNLDASLVQTPQYINPSILKYDFKDDVLKDFNKTEEMLNKSKSKVIEGTRGARYWLKYIFDYIDNTKLDYSHYNRFLVYRKKSDQIWNQNFNDYFVNYQIDDNELVRVN